ncbi:MAG: molecular chaperone DnaJ [Candidatus Aminicenantes bacterium]|nr:molecular chaperone DnaJ [Candidatus Aminicenantes bacterium]
MTKKDFYEILDLPRNATSEEIKKSYRQMALKYHPDRNPGDKTAEEKFKEAAEAYSVLIDPEKRSTYDRFGHDGLRAEGFSGFSGFNSSIFEDFEDILGNFFSFSFGDLFGTQRRARAHYPQRGRDLSLDLEISLEEAAFGAEKEIKLDRVELCSVCHGSKLQPGTQKTVCRQCQGRGQVRYQQGFFAISRTCSHCGGSGEIITTPCKECRGSGKMRKKKDLRVKIPLGIKDGMGLRLEREGEAGDREAPRGDLYVVVRVKKHEIFEREENNLFCQITISFIQAALGATAEIPTLEGNEVIKIPAGTQPGEVFRLKGKGIKSLGGYRKGDLFVKVNVKIPEKLTKEQKALLQKFAESAGEDLKAVYKSIIDKTKNIVH